MIPPIIAGFIITFAPLEPVVKAGIMLMAVSPVPPLVPGKELKVGGRKEYAYGLYIALALLTMLSVPIVYAIASSLFGRPDTVSFASIAGRTLAGVIVPLAIGVAIRELAPRFADRVWNLVFRISMLLLVFAFVPLLIKIWPAISALIGGGAVVAMVAVIVIIIVVAHALGGPDLNDRATLAVASSVRHPGIAVSIAGAQFDDPRVSAAVLLFMLVGMVVAALYSAWIKRQRTALAH